MEPEIMPSKSNTVLLNIFLKSLLLKSFNASVIAFLRLSISSFAVRSASLLNIFLFLCTVLIKTLVALCKVCVFCITRFNPSFVPPTTISTEEHTTALLKFFVIDSNPMLKTFAVDSALYTICNGLCTILSTPFCSVPPLIKEEKETGPISKKKNNNLQLFINEHKCLRNRNMNNIVDVQIILGASITIFFENVEQSINFLKNVGYR